MRRPYFFEIAALSCLLAIAFFSGGAIPGGHSPLLVTAGFTFGIAVQIGIGVLIRLAVTLVRGDRRYLRRVRSRRWLVDTFRLALGGGAMITAYLWIKLLVPILHPRLFDEELWALDQLLLFGLAPTILLLDLFAGPALHVVDLTYAKVFYVSSVLATVFFLAHPGRRLRIGFANGNALLWLSGAWLYMLVPSLGPAFRFPEIWMAHSDSFSITQSLQALLMRNYQNVLREAGGGEVSAPIHVAFGIGAFPSLHVAFQFYVFLWMRRIWTSGELLFGVFAVTIFLGSMITGWHYLVDSLAGIVIGWIAWRLFWTSGRLTRWVELTERLRKAE